MHVCSFRLIKLLSQLESFICRKEDINKNFLVRQILDLVQFFTRESSYCFIAS